MPTTINASNTSGGAIITPDGSGVLELQSGGVTGLTVSGANVTVAGTLTATGGLAALTSPVSVIGNATAGAEIRLPEDTDNGANYVAIKAPNALAANLTFTLPTADGTNGQYLQTNGSGQLAFATVPTTSPGGTTGQIQFNNAGVFGGVTAVPVANGGTGATTLTANNVLLGNGTSAVQEVAPGTAGNLLTSNGTTWVSQALSTAVQYPQNSQSANYTLVLGDAGKMIFHPASDTTLRTYTIPANSSVPFPIGTVVLFTAENGAFSVRVQINNDTLIFGNGTTGTIVVSANQTLMAIKVTATKWMANYLYQTGSPVVPTFSVALPDDSSGPSVNVYSWSASGFGGRYSDPGSLAFSSYDVAFSPSGNAMAVAEVNTRIGVYAFTGSAIGSRFSDPASLPSNDCRGIAFSPAGTEILASRMGTPFVVAWPWSGSGFGTQFSNPATLPTSDGRGVAFHPSGNAVAVMQTSATVINVYAWSSAGFGTRFSNPATLPDGAGGGVTFSPSGDAIAITGNTTTNPIVVYAWSGAGFGTRFSDPATTRPDFCRDVDFHPNGSAIAIAHGQSPFISVYAWSSSGFGSRFTNPATLPSGAANGVSFSPTGTELMVANDGSPFVRAWPWSGSGFGTAFSNPVALPGSSCKAVAFTFNP
jgi:hypothetical protein